MEKTESLTKILKRSKPRTEPCGAPNTTSCHSLNVEPTFTLLLNYQTRFEAEKTIDISD